MSGTCKNLLVLGNFFVPSPVISAQRRQCAHAAALFRTKDDKWKNYGPNLLFETNTSIVCDIVEIQSLLNRICT